MFHPSDVMKYSIFFPNAILAVISAGAVVSGFVMSLMFKYILVFEFPYMSFLKELPVILKCAGAIVFLMTFLGSSGAILDGVVGKWLLIGYMISMSIFVLLSIYVLGALHMIHKGDATPIAEELKFSDIGKLNPFHDTKLEAMPTEDQTDTTIEKIKDETLDKENTPLHSTEKIDSREKTGPEDEKSESSKPKKSGNIFNKYMTNIKNKVKNTYDGAVNTAHKITDNLSDSVHNTQDRIKQTVHAASDMKDDILNKADDVTGGFLSKTAHKVTEGLSGTVHNAKDAVDHIKDKVVDTANEVTGGKLTEVAHIAQNMKEGMVNVAHDVQDKFNDAVHTAQDVANTVKKGVINTATIIGKGIKTAIGFVYTLQVTITATASFIADLFDQLTPLEQERVKWVQPILGRLTPPAFRLSAYPLAMKFAIGGVVTEVVFILLVAVYSTTKDNRF